MFPSSYYDICPSLGFFLISYLMVLNDACVISSSLLAFAGFSWIFYLYYRSREISTNGRGVLVTGCASGFGHQLAIKLHALGFTVFACCLDDESDGGRKLKSIGKDTGRLHVIKMDVTNEVEVRQAFLYVKDNLPRLGLWGLVNNAGRSYVSFIEWFPMEFYEKLLEVNLLGTIRVTQTFLPLIRKSQGRIVVTSSILGRLVTTWFGPYSITKFGLEAFSDALRVEMYRFKVKVCIVEPGNFMAATRIVGKEGPEASAYQFWDQLSDPIQQDYGKEKMSKWVAQRMDYVMSLSSHDISPVVDAMTDCVYRRYPKDRYFVASCKDKILSYIYLFVPTYITDLINLFYQ